MLPGTAHRRRRGSCAHARHIAASRSGAFTVSSTSTATGSPPPGADGTSSRSGRCPRAARQPGPPGAPPRPPSVANGPPSVANGPPSARSRHLTAGSPSTSNPGNATASETAAAQHADACRAAPGPRRTGTRPAIRASRRPLAVTVCSGGSPCNSRQERICPSRTAAASEERAEPVETPRDRASASALTAPSGAAQASSSRRAISVMAFIGRHLPTGASARSGWRQARRAVRRLPSPVPARRARPVPAAAPRSASGSCAQCSSG